MTTNFLVLGSGDLTIEWDAASHESVIGEIQALIDRGIAFYKLGDRRKVAARPISGTGAITERTLLIKDADIDKIVHSLLRNYSIQQKAEPSE